MTQRTDQAPALEPQAEAVTDEGEAINESQRIVEWARNHPATSSPSAA
jgi:hypothetical protein